MAELEELIMDKKVSKQMLVIYLYLEKNTLMTQQEIADGLSVALPTISIQLKNLLDLGLIVKDNECPARYKVK